MILSAALRYLLWLGVAWTARANRERYRMRTTWLPHLIGNTVVLLLPDVVRGVASVLGHGETGGKASRSPLATLGIAFGNAIGRNAAYAAWVAPFALGYILSHPDRNIYQGRLAERRLLGLGPDAIPHAATAFGFTMVAADGLAALDRATDRLAPTAGLVRWAADHASAISAALLGLVTFGWELSEYRIHRHELRVQGGRRDRINMMWSPGDTAADIAANALGWLAATALRRLA